MLINIVTSAMTKTKTKRESQREIKPIAATETSRELPNAQIETVRL
jgi:hypothetical protein